MFHFGNSKCIFLLTEPASSVSCTYTFVCFYADKMPLTSATANLHAWYMCEQEENQGHIKQTNVSHQGVRAQRKGEWKGLGGALPTCSKVIRGWVYINKSQGVAFFFPCVLLEEMFWKAKATDILVLWEWECKLEINGSAPLSIWSIKLFCNTEKWSMEYFAEGNIPWGWKQD